MRPGRGSAPCHHGELLQGFFRDSSGAARPGLVTLPSPVAGVRAEFRPSGTGTEVTVRPPGRVKAARAARLALDAVAGPGTGGGQLTLHGAVPPGLGLGSSTADVVASVRAVADATGTRIAPHTLARLAVAAEAASDPLMFDDARPRLFAQRDGDVLEVLPGELPRLLVVGCLLDGGRPVDTPAVRPPEPPAPVVGTYEELRAELRAALAAGDPAGIARVATRSAQLHRTDGEVDRLRAAVEGPGVLGVQIAHSGNVAGVLLAPGDGVAADRVTAALRAAGLVPTGRFTAGGAAHLRPVAAAGGTR
ncbi:hypothetical protein AD006_26760 [Pseudonocardia sp. EC080610-09]|uniref:GHMP family kinase ATP-binding protein n=1 Tax=unclassified Pseudonocardia TaxID=2619320 RepID=UPI0007062E80|nr:MULTISPECIES: hypothetical protein [unclassified Pseudonocardia]ALL78009.1 hypothetical protein AD006_26760 [Pseudonocardia sp. EC080610-09]ALL80922.1 hypothetical protein AD017_06355 [Pseudonocardia sp. EC080619-01]